MERAKLNRSDYPGYNLLLGDLNELYYYSNVGIRICICTLKVAILAAFFALNQQD
ncbi:MULTISPECIES: hypothetical protein [Paenibacillus]|uniref:hypothetical protein n=1 Tax=Paenibacillus TaxID=44249 RepID=UPI001F0816F3|nr:hypothetical protein [Paenibacillus sp. ALJ109b]